MAKTFKGIGKNLTVRQLLEINNNIGMTVMEDDTGTYTYIGKAVSGTATSDSDWWIIRLTNADNTLRNADLADSDSIFSNKWSSRTSLTYS